MQAPNSYNPSQNCTIWRRTTPSKGKEKDIQAKGKEKDIQENEERKKIIAFSPLTIASGCLKPNYSGHIASFPKRSSLALDLQKVLSHEEYPRSLKGCLPLTIDTCFSFGKSHGFHPIYLTRIMTVYLLEEAGKRWTETCRIKVTASSFTPIGSQNITSVNVALATSVKRYDFQKISSIANKKKFNAAFQEKSLAFLELEKGRVAKIHVSQNYYDQMRAKGAEFFALEIHDFLKPWFLLMPNNYTLCTYENEGYELLVETFKQST